MQLMHRNHVIAEVKRDYLGLNITEIYDKRRMPRGMDLRNDLLIQSSFKNWYQGRAIPNMRPGLDKIEMALGNCISSALIKSMALSLTDCYWIRPDDIKTLTWEDVNFHDNGFSDELVNVVIYNDDIRITNLRSPDFTTDGLQKKVWMNNENIPYLVKFGDFGDNAHGKNLLSANEVVAYRIGKAMDCNIVPYEPAHIVETDEVVCMCPCFIQSSESEFVTALQEQRANGWTDMDYYHAFSKMGYQKELDQMIVLDHIIHNTDRHSKNFGLIRDAETMEMIGIAPIFDSGSSFQWNRSKYTFDTSETQPFKRTREDQLAIVNTHIDIPEESFVKDVLKEEYERFDIKESVLCTALEDVRKSYQMLERVYLAVPDIENSLTKNNEDIER